MATENMLTSTTSGNGLEHERARLGGIIAAKPPISGAQKGAQRRYFRAFLEVAQIVSRPPAGAGKRLRGRIARAAEGFAELRAIADQMKAAARL